MGTFVRHAECLNPKCGSSDGRGVYEDGSSWCFVCETYFHADGAEGDTNPHFDPTTFKFSKGDYVDIPKRGLKEATCRKYGYQVAKDRHIAPYRGANGQIIAQKIRKAGKDFSVEPAGVKDLPLYGQHLWNGGKSVVITEGEIDALSVAQAFDLKWAVVSLPNGAGSAVKALKKAYDWLDQFENIVLCFDADEQGEKAVQEGAPILPIGKVKVMTMPMSKDGKRRLKDANEVLLELGPQAIVKAFWDAKEWRPDGVVSIRDIRERAKKPVEWGLPWAWDALTKGTYGRRWGEVYTFGAGTGVGKTDLLTQQIEFDVNTLNEEVGVFFLEQPIDETVRRIAGKFDGKAYHIPENTDWTQEEYERAVDRLCDDNRVHLYDHFGQSDWEVIKTRIRYMNRVKGIRIFYVDNLTALADPSRERESLEIMTREIAGLAQELMIIIHLVSHLATPEGGKSHEEGAEVALRHFKGARAIGFWTHFAFGLERNKKDEDPIKKNTMKVVCLKDRKTGRFDGGYFYLHYDHRTCRLNEIDPKAFFADLEDDGSGLDI